MKFAKSILFFVHLILVMTGSSFAQENPATIEAAYLKGSPIITISYLFQLFLSLLIVFGLMYVIAKYVLPKIKTSTSGEFIRVIDRVGLEPQVGAYIIKVKDSSWLVIISNKNVSVVSKLESL